MNLLGRIGFFVVYLYGCLLAPLTTARFVIFIIASTAIYVFTIHRERLAMEREAEERLKQDS